MDEARLEALHLLPLKADFDRVRELIYKHAGISLHDGKHAMVYSRVSRRLRDTGHSSFKTYLDWLEQQTGKPVLAVLPYLHGLFLDAEDAVQPVQAARGAFRVVVPSLPRMSNHTDFDALRAHPDVDLHFVRQGEPIPAADLIILPGSKNTRGDLEWLRAQGWPEKISHHLRYGGKLLGICGGLQMLGTQLHDPLGLEGAAGSSAGLGLLAFDTVLEAEKQLRNVRGRLVLGEALGVGAAGGEFEGVLGDQLAIGLLPGAVVDQEGDAALGRQAVMVAADREDVPVGLKVLGIDHLAIEGTLGPETCRDILLLRSRGVRTLAEDSHGE